MAPTNLDGQYRQCQVKVGVQETEQVNTAGDKLDKENGRSVSSPLSCNPTSDSFDIVCPTIEHPLDEILMKTGDCLEAWPMPIYAPSRPLDYDRQGSLNLIVVSNSVQHSEPTTFHPPS